jgi:hypothetical protein
MNYVIVSAKEVTYPNKSIKAAVSVRNNRSGKTHVGYQYHNGRVDILARAGMTMRWKTVILPTR